MQEIQLGILQVRQKLLSNVNWGAQVLHVLGVWQRIQLLTLQAIHVLLKRVVPPLHTQVPRLVNVKPCWHWLQMSVKLQVVQYDWLHK